MKEIFDLIASYIECYQTDLDLNISYTKTGDIRVELECIEDVNTLAGAIFNDLRDEVFANGYITNDVLRKLQIEVNYHDMIIYIKKR